MAPPNYLIKYDLIGNRVFKQLTASGQTTTRKYIVDVSGGLPTILLEIDPADSLIKKSYFYANGEVLMQYNGNHKADKYFYLHDRLGSVRQIINSAGNVVHHYTYGPFGQTIEESSTEPPATSNSFMFTGQWFDTEIGQYYLRARQYDPVLMRFSSRDPVFGQFEEPMTLHKYLYCRNDSVNKWDPLGLLAYYVTGSFGAALGIGTGQQQVGITWDDQGNQGIIITESVGIGMMPAAEISAGVQFGITFDNENIDKLGGEGWSLGGSLGKGELASANLGVDFFGDKGSYLPKGIEVGIGGSVGVSMYDIPIEGHLLRTKTQVRPFKCTTYTFQDVAEMAVEETWDRSRSLHDYYTTMILMDATNTDFDFLSN